MAKTTKTAQVAHELMGSPVYVLIEVRGGIIDVVQTDYNKDKLIALGQKSGDDGFRDGEDDIVVWDGGMEGGQVWHYESAGTEEEA